VHDLIDLLCGIWIAFVVLLTKLINKVNVLPHGLLLWHSCNNSNEHEEEMKEHEEESKRKVRGNERRRKRRRGIDERLTD